MNKNQKKIRNDISELEVELNKLEIKYKFASDNDLPGQFPTGESNESFKTFKYIDNLSSYKVYLFERIKFYKKKIELLKLKLELHEENVANTKKIEREPLIDESPDEKDKKEDSSEKTLSKTDIENIINKLEITLNNDEKWKGIKAYGGRKKFGEILEKIYQAEYDGKGIRRVDYIKSLFPPLNKKYRLKNKFDWDEKKLENSMKKSY